MTSTSNIEWEWESAETAELVGRVQRIAQRVTAARLPAGTHPGRIAESANECAGAMLAALAADPALAHNVDALFLIADAESQADYNAEARLHSLRGSRAYRGDEINIRGLADIVDPAERRAIAGRLSNIASDSLTPAKVDAILAAAISAGTWDALALRPGHEASHAGNVREPMSATTVAMMRPADAALDAELHRAALAALAAPVVTLTAGTTLTADQQRAALLAAYQWDAAPLVPRESAVNEADELRPTRLGGVVRFTSGDRQPRLTRNGRDAHSFKRRRGADDPAPRFDAFTAELVRPAVYAEPGAPGANVHEPITPGEWRERGRGNAPGSTRFGYRAATINYAAVARAVFGDDASPADVKRVTRFLREWARVALENVAAVIDAGRTPTGLLPYAVTPDPGRRVAPRGKRTTRTAFTLRGRRVQRSAERLARDKRLTRAALDAGRAAFTRSLTPGAMGPHPGIYIAGTREWWRDSAGATITAAQARRERIAGRRVYRYAAKSSPRVIPNTPRAQHSPGAPITAGNVRGVSGADADRYAAWSACADAVTRYPGAALTSDPATTDPRASTPTARQPRTGSPRGMSGARVARWDAAGGLPVVSSSRFYRAPAGTPTPAPAPAPLPSAAVTPCAECRALPAWSAGVCATYRHPHTHRAIAGPVRVELPGDQAPGDDADQAHACGECGRVFGTPRGRDQHSRKAHAA